MEKRIGIPEVQPEAYKALKGLENYTAQTSLDPLQKELIKIRASQLNGCSFCLNMHVKDARKKGMPEEKAFLISAWREAENVFSEEELLLLQITEEVTLIHKQGLTDSTYEKAIELFGAIKTAEIIMCVITINGWNRMAITTRLQPVLENK